MPFNPSIVMIGAGNVGFHLAQRLHEKGIDIQQVFSRKITKARKTAKKVSAEAVNDLQLIQKNADIYIVAVHDDAIAQVAEQLEKLQIKGLVVHTSGSTPSTVLKPYSKNYGCFYPLQTFSIKRQADFDTIPICIYSPQKRNRVKLDWLANRISSKVYEINDQQKSVLHVAAVFANNFSNYLFHIAQSITREENIDFDILKPLILETAEKIQHQSPRQMQTGPARRGDQESIKRHLEYLESTHPQWAKLYRLLSEGISSEF